MPEMEPEVSAATMTKKAEAIHAILVDVSYRDGMVIIGAVLGAILAQLPDSQTKHAAFAIAASAALGSNR